MSNQTKAQGYEGLILRIIVAIVVLIGAALICNYGLGVIADLNSQPEGIIDGNLTDCSSDSACLSTENAIEDANYIESIPLTISIDEAITILQNILPELAGASVKEATDSYFLVRVGSLLSDNTSDLEVYINFERSEIQMKIEPYGRNTSIEWTRRQIERLRLLYEQELE